MNQNPNVAKFSPAKKMELTDAELEGDLGFGVPERHLQPIYDAVQDYLQQTGTNPADVLFSGFHGGGGPPENDQSYADRQGIETSIKQLAQKANKLFNDGYYDQHPEERASMQAQIQALKDSLKENRQKATETAGQSNFFFTGIEGLQGEPNPIDYAAIAGTPVIGIYDKAKLTQLPGYDPQAHIATATLEDVEATKVAEVYPHYFDKQGEPV